MGGCLSGFATFSIFLACADIVWRIVQDARSSSSDDETLSDAVQQQDDAKETSENIALSSIKTK
jgi:hypothetical protein